MSGAGDKGTGTTGIDEGPGISTREDGTPWTMTVGEGTVGSSGVVVRVGNSGTGKTRGSTSVTGGGTSNGGGTREALATYTDLRRGSACCLSSGL